MEKISLNGDFVVCRELEKEEEDRSTFFIFNKEEVKQYQIVELHLREDSDFPFSIGDIVVSGSTGTIVIDNNVKKKLFRPEHVLAKILKPNHE